MRKCDHCKYEWGEWCTHPTIDKKEYDSKIECTKTGDWSKAFSGSIWKYIDDTPKWCPLLNNSTHGE